MRPLTESFLENVESFVRAVERLGFHNPLDGREIIVGVDPKLDANDPAKYVAIEIRLTPGSSKVHFNIRALNPGKGSGSKGLKAFVKLADEHGVELAGIAKPFGTKALGKKALVAWYKKNGFKVSGDSILREPKAKAEATASAFEDEAPGETVKILDELMRVDEPSERGSMNAFHTSDELAMVYAKSVLGEERLAEDMPDFLKGLAALRAAAKHARPIKRSEMPVLAQDDIDAFDKALRNGRIDLFKPFALGQLSTPTNLSPVQGAAWVNLGLKDGDLKDDVVKGQWGYTKANKLKPTQMEVWLDKLIARVAEKGAAQMAAFGKKATLIVSSDNYIIDGHHRWGGAMLVDPDMPLRTLTLPIPLSLLLRIGRSFGAARGNRQRG